MDICFLCLLRVVYVQRLLRADNSFPGVFEWMCVCLRDIENSDIVQPKTGMGYCATKKKKKRKKYEFIIFDNGAVSTTLFTLTAE